MKKRLTLVGLVAPALIFTEPARLQIFSPEQPVSLFFRETEGTAAQRRLSYEEWNTRYSRLAGVMGKMLDEEIVGRSAAQPYYRRFKAEHPDQAVLLHANGTFRSPKADNRGYHAGHWLYYNGARVLDALPVQSGNVTIRVADATRFVRSPYRVNPEVPEDIGLCALTRDGKPDWNRAEQAMLVAVDATQGTITIQRGVYGSSPQAFAAGTAYAAAHVAQTWGSTNKLWQFNMAITCPRDAAGRTAADVWAGELAAAMRPGGAIEFVDGVEFDVPFRQPMLLGRNRQADCDADGQPDNGVIGGVPVFARGVDNFFRILRAALPAKLILADVGERAQRSVGTLNGVETEGWPHLRDLEFLHWSTALNDHRYWGTRAQPPIFTYGLLKYRGVSNVPPSAVRLSLAGPLLVDAAVPMDYAPPEGSSGVWDELLGGTLNRRGWLGRPSGPARWLALEAPDLLAGQRIAQSVTSTDATVKAVAGRIEAQALQPAAAGFSLRLGGLRLQEKTDVVVVVEASATISTRDHPDSYRTLTAALVQAGAQPQKTAELPASPMAAHVFSGRYTFRQVPAGACDLVLIAEGAEPITLHAISVHAAPDLAVREYAHGVILANPSHQAQKVALDALFPGIALGRLQATAGQDFATNNGAPVRGGVMLPAKDALFLKKIVKANSP